VFFFFVSPVEPWKKISTSDCVKSTAIEKMNKNK